MNQYCSVTNKAPGRTVYLIREDRIRREFAPRETKKNIPVAELEKLVQQPGGLSLLYNRLMVHDAEVLRYLINGKEAPEYWITEEQIPHWIETCSLEEFQDALDFAPEGTKELIKKYAVSLPLKDMSKHQAIKTQLGFNSAKAIENSAEAAAAVEAAASVKPAGRRTVSSIQEPTEKKIVISE